MTMLTMLTTEPPAARPSNDSSEKYANSSDLSSGCLLATTNAASAPQSEYRTIWQDPGQ